MEARFSAPIQTGPGAHPASCTMGTGVFPGVKSGRGVTLTPYFLQVPWSIKGRAIPLLPLWAVRPVQSFSAFTTVHCTFIFLYNSFTEFPYWSSIIHLSLTRPCISQEVSRWLLIAETRVPYLVNPCKVCGGQSSIGMEFPLSVSLKQ